MGLVHRIGDGAATSIWDDPWIPNIAALKPTGRMGNAPLELFPDLIEPYNNSWNIDLVRQSFFHHEAEAILNIPLSQSGGEDSLAWALEKSGIYTVKSAYRSLVTRNELRSIGEATSTESSSANKRMWIDLWKLKVMPKVRVF
ncbi:Alanyl-tRNA synthetase [Hordeum vulgare]|nr:Alanyl-tRNA synthetase [Hordeum vulgare]